MVASEDIEVLESNVVVSVWCCGRALSSGLVVIDMLKISASPLNFVGCVFARFNTVMGQGQKQCAQVRSRYCRYAFQPSFSNMARLSSLSISQC